MMNSITTQILISAVTAMLSSGVLVALIQFYSKKPEVDATAKNLNVTAEISVGEAWRKYAEKQEEVVKSLIQKHEDLDKKYTEEIRLKDIIIDNLKKEVILKNQTIATLEVKLSENSEKNITNKDERGIMHKAIDKSFDKMETE